MQSNFRCLRCWRKYPKRFRNPSTRCEGASRQGNADGNPRASSVPWAMPEHQCRRLGAATATNGGKLINSRAAPFASCRIHVKSRANFSINNRKSALISNLPSIHAVRGNCLETFRWERWLIRTKTPHLTGFSYHEYRGKAHRP